MEPKRWTGKERERKKDQTCLEHSSATRAPASWTAGVQGMPSWQRQTPPESTASSQPGLLAQQTQEGHRTHFLPTVPVAVATATAQAERGWFHLPHETGREQSRLLVPSDPPLDRPWAPAIRSNMRKWHSNKIITVNSGKVNNKTITVNSAKCGQQSNNSEQWNKWKAIHEWTTKQ